MTFNVRLALTGVVRATVLALNISFFIAVIIYFRKIIIWETQHRTIVNLGSFYAGWSDLKNKLHFAGTY